MGSYDAVVVGSGPNGLSAALVLAQAGLSVLVLEAKDTIGGGARSSELTLPGFVHDICSAVHPLAIGSPFFRTLPLGEHGLEWIHPPTPCAHPLDDGTACLLERSLEQTAATIAPDGRSYMAQFAPLADRWETLAPELLGPLRLPRRPFLMARFGLAGIRSAQGFAASHFRGQRARALFAGLAGHSVISLSNLGSAAFGLVLAAAGHALGWPIPRGGSQRIADALASHLRSLGGRIQTGAPVRSAVDLPPAKVVLFDITPRQLLTLVGDRLPARYRRSLARFRYGPGVFKLDWALAGPIPWKAAECARAGTVHLGGSIEEIAEAEAAVWQGKLPQRPFVLLAQPSLFDPTRAPEGCHTGWAYCHVPHGSKEDMTQYIEAQVERFAPGFRDLILGRSAMNTTALEQHNPNLVGGDISGGANLLRQVLLRPTPSWNSYRLPVSGWYLCSSSTPPGGGVHGMCGYHAARAALRNSFR